MTIKTISKALCAAMGAIAILSALTGSPSAGVVYLPPGGGNTVSATATPAPTPTTIFAGNNTFTGTQTVATGSGVAGTNGAGFTWVVGSESITLSTSGATTDSAANLLPANSLIDAVVCRVTTTITTATDWEVGDATTSARFISADSTMTANETQVGLNHMAGNVSTTAAGPTQASAAKIRITTTGTPGAGVIRCEVFARTYTAPTS